MYHIKKDGAFLCSTKSNSKKSKETSISFTAAINSTLNGCCPMCKQFFVSQTQQIK